MNPGHTAEALTGQPLAVEAASVGSPAAAMFQAVAAARRAEQRDHAG